MAKTIIDVARRPHAIRRQGFERWSQEDFCVQDEDVAITLVLAITGTDRGVPSFAIYFSPGYGTTGGTGGVPKLF
jgi:hypothetical protein